MICCQSVPSSRHRAQFDEGLPFKGSRLPALAVVVLKCLDTGGEGAMRAVRSQPQIDLEDAGTSRHDVVTALLYQQLGLLPRGDLLPCPVRCPLTTVDAEHFDV